MDSYSRKLISFIFTLLLGLNTAFAASIEDEVSQFIKLSKLKRDIERAISEARLINPEEPFFLIRQVDLKLQGVWRGEGKAEFSVPVWIFEVDLSADAAFQQSEELEVELFPPEKAVVGGDRLIDLSPLITMLKETFSNDGLQGKSIKFTRKWALQRAVEGGADMIVFKVGGGISDERAQSITFHLCQTSNFETCVPTNE